MDNKSTYQKVIQGIIIAVSLMAAFLHVGKFTFLTVPSILFYILHVMIGFVLTFIYFPLGRKMKEKTPAQTVLFRVIDWIFIALTVAVSLYISINFETYTTDMQNNHLTTELFVMGCIMAVITLEVGRRVLGNVLPIIAILAVLYALFGNHISGLFGHRGYKMSRVLLSIFSDRGIYGSPIATSANNVFLFLLFAAYLNVSHADRIFQDIAIALAGKKRGGPAKMAVVASAFFGTISGSCVANVVSTGAFTIPLMKRNGYRSRFAGAVEAVASTGGQIMPPIMGAAAFVMADITGISYATICLAALLPALMYYFCLFKMVDLESVKHQLHGLPPEMIPDLKTSVKRGIKLFVPVIVLLVLMIGLGMTPMLSAIWSIAAIIVCAFLDKNDRMKLKDLLQGMISAGRSMVTVVAACATAGIVVGMFSMTGLGNKFSDFILQLGSNALIPSLILSMLVCAVLGMGLPTTAAYIVCATAIAPALTNLGLARLPAHLFLLYFASISAITPPVAVASFAAAGIADENPMKVGFTAVKLGITGFILPFAFALNNDYVNFGFNFQTLITWLSGFVISYSLAIALQGYIEQKITIVERLAFVVVIGLAIVSNVWTSIGGIALFCALYGFRVWQGRKQKAVA